MPGAGDREQQVAFLYFLPFLKMHLTDHALDLRMDRHRRIGHHMANRRRVNLHWQVGLDCHCHEHRNTGPGTRTALREQPLTSKAATSVTRGMEVRIFHAGFSR